MRMLRSKSGEEIGFGSNWFEASSKRTNTGLDFGVWRRPSSEVFGLNNREICRWCRGDAARRFQAAQRVAARVSGSISF
ncbi:hypothetical protein COLO4_02720 [Corchorus olitorius]|uniref:Uncharacterized protein n=1 Tax=Corchorus olitorius TaxID=93759 RepID=A0A1R3L0F3_9ROSI|nr:hypothetical protein COLO4_02720 [Corchorus olitorius]